MKGGFWCKKQKLSLSKEMFRILSSFLAVVTRSKMVFLFLFISPSFFFFLFFFLTRFVGVPLLGVPFSNRDFSKAIRKSLLLKFSSAVPVFFQLCSELFLSRTENVQFLARSLLFSVLYGQIFVFDDFFLAQLESLFFWRRWWFFFFFCQIQCRTCLFLLFFLKFPFRGNN